MQAPSSEGCAAVDPSIRRSGGTILEDCTTIANIKTATISLADKSLSGVMERDEYMMHMQEGIESVSLSFGRSDTFEFYSDDKNFLPSSATTKDPSPSSDIGTWVHWAGTFERTTYAMTVYRGGAKQALRNSDGDSIGTENIAGAASSVNSPITFGSSSSGFSPFTGSMDELRTYVGIALAAAQLTSVMSSASTSQGGLISSLNFDTSNLLLDAACGSSSNATSSGNFTATASRNYGVTATTGKVCGAVSSAGSTCP